MNRRTVLNRALSGAFISLAFAVPLAAHAADPIRIGWLSSLTGALSSAAIAENQGVQFAIDEINNAGGINGSKLELLTRDTVGDPTKAVNLANQLIHSDKVAFIIGPVNSGESLATVPVVSRAGIPNIVIGSVDELIDPVKYPRAFRVISSNEQWVRNGNDYATKTLKKTKVAIIADTTGYGVATAKKAAALLEAQGIKPVYSVVVDANKTSLTDEMTKAREAGADVVMPWSAATGLLARVLNARGDMQWNVPVVGHPAIMGTPIKALLNAPGYWENTFSVGYASTTYDANGQLPAATRKLMEAIKPKLGGKIDFTFWWVAMGYDTVKVIEHAIRTAGSTDPAKIQAALEKTQKLPGVYAPFYSYGLKERNGFPDEGIAINRASTFKDGSFERAPQ
ncbi:ABC transporter substrate-binding protein [Xylophilus sp. GOD-11R]|uniref:ABC transporter substrate-binding protein n=1 Tax=Xylophilus sp. GOD-11R TaxID=3089814 RepID=UPI00298C7597|nr:ABC transporter substrate-binding protein [Xylophilus sp. GOD-11R]WPB58382.1 ABC transporter substrate-binding protein [Xylophilus sp. GOD-11R]